MSEARSRDNWAHTASILALTANCHRDPKKSKPFTAEDFNPHAHEDKKNKDPMEGFYALKAFFPDKKGQ